MEGVTPGHHALLRPTDRARQLLRRAQVGLAALAALISVPVGLAAAADHGDPSGRATVVQAQLLEPAVAPDVSVAGSRVPVRAYWRESHGALRIGTVWADAGLPRGTGVPVSLGDDGTVTAVPPTTGSPVAAGLVAALGTLGLCWAVLAIGGTLLRSRLAARDSADWASGWARVEPVWSGRRTV